MTETGPEPSAKKGLVAIIDALGVRAMSASEIGKTLKILRSISRSLETGKEDIKNKGGTLPKEVNTFLLNDTIVIALESGSEPALADVGTMCWLLNRAIVPAFFDRVFF